MPAKQSSLPTQCQSICNPVVTILNGNCTPLQECCTDAFIGNLTACYECVGNATSVSNYSVPQTSLDQLAVECAEEGLTIDDPTLPGQNPNRTVSGLPTSSGSAAGSSTSSFLQSTITSGFTAPTFTQSTVTALTSATSPSATSPTASTTPSSGNSSSSGASNRDWSWKLIAGSICAAWAAAFIGV
ncbi:hypothetical protein BT96DRAFT_1019732 [Gymnopus androsaceus JB14]|uniref:Uncharacterized protein n=1 Tax=Gymnopus androsaceus JB14 TaxID=1447944 RepID=A0A6A4HQV0_9AGAR|nr:hypothetical protein BT96DRAFT_1019732 [Gymnopus androsaceus JB14]